MPYSKIGIYYSIVIAILILASATVNAGTANYTSSISCVGGQESQCFSASAIGTTDCLSGDGCSTVCKDSVYKYGPGTAGGSGWMGCVDPNTKQPVASGTSGVCAWESIGSCTQDGQVFGISGTGYCSAGWGCVYDQTVSGTACPDGYQTNCTYKKRISSAWPDQSTCTPSNDCTNHRCGNVTCESEENLTNCLQDCGCKDTDNGSNYYVKGSGTGLFSYSRDRGIIFGENANSCSLKNVSGMSYSILYDCCGTETGGTSYAHILSEVYCRNNEVWNYSYSCPNGCSNGTCIPSCTAPQCNPNNTNQYCSNYEWANCPTGQVCSNGICGSSCSSSNLSACTSSSSCTSANGNWCAATSGNYVCQSTACSTTAVNCTDTDNGIDGYTKGTSTGLYGNTKLKGWIYGENPDKASSRTDTSMAYSIYYDHCFDANSSNTSQRNQVNEGYCDSQGLLQSYGYSCPNGCKDGVCIAATSTCSNSNLSTCTTQSTCQGASGYWCTSNNQCYAGSISCCSSNNPDGCTAQTPCQNAGLKWCTPSSGTPYCTDLSCTTETARICSSTPAYNIENCKTETECKNATGNWCYSAGHYLCSNTACPTCNSSQPYVCNTETACKGVNGNWCPNSGSVLGYICTDYTCPALTPSLCTSTSYPACRDATECSSAGGKWCTGGAYLNSYCTTSNDTCTITADGGSCGNGVCNKGEGEEYGPVMCPFDCGGTTGCSSQNPQGCTNSTDCQRVGYKWCTTGAYGPYCENPTYTCSTPNTCSANNYNYSYCYDQTNCTNAGGKWCSSGPYGGAYCTGNTCPTYTCSRESTGYCYTESECSNAGGSWCKTGSLGGNYCTMGSCPVCTKDNPGNCYTESECKNAAANWCVTGTTGYCQTNTCPTCTAETKYACASELECKQSNGNWCKNSTGYNCQNEVCAVCSREQYWNCFSEGECKNAGGNWKVYPGSTKGNCVKFEPPVGYCGNNVCESGEYTNCPRDCQVVCPNEKQLKRERTYCEQANGKPVEIPAKDGCPYIKCEFGQEHCPSEEERSAMVKTCEQSGGVPVFKKVPRGQTGSCVYVSCENRQICPDKDSQEQTRKKCLELGLEPYVITGYTGCPVIQCKTQFDENRPIVPPVCLEEIDAFTGYARYVCQPIRMCPSLDKQADAKKKCVELGGRADVYTGPYGCEYYTCKFGEKELFQQCPRAEELKKIINTCTDEGNKYRKVVERGCTLIHCGTEDEFREREFCGEGRINYEELEAKKRACTTENGAFIEHFDEVTKCPVFDCVSRERMDEVCGQQQLPEEAFQQCAEQGGELVVTVDENKCPTLVECVQRPDDQVIVEDPKEVPDSGELLDIAFKLERLAVVLDALERQSQEIISYYEGTSNLERAERFKRVQGLLRGAKETVEKIKNELRENVDHLTLENVKEVRTQIRYIKEVILKEILYIMLAKEVPGNQTETKNCEGSETCFTRSLRLCAPAYMEGGSAEFSGKIEITGLKENACAVQAQALVRGENYDMSCAIENYAFADLGIETLQKYCTGSLLDKMLEQGVRTEIPLESRQRNETNTEDTNLLTSVAEIIMAPLKQWTG